MTFTVLYHQDIFAEGVNLQVKKQEIVSRFKS